MSSFGILAAIVEDPGLSHPMPGLPTTAKSGDVRATALELASSLVFGVLPGPPLPALPTSLSSCHALEEAVRPHLDRKPCLVSFSGGRDSSSVLAVAARVARREGLPLPVPITIRYREAPDADESAWQELVVAHLGLEDWERVEIEDELDYLGPLAARLLQQHGVRWPPYFHYEHLLLSKAAGGVLLTGHDGDAVFGHWRWASMTTVRRRERRPGARDLARIILAKAPEQAKRWEARRHLPPLDWLRPEALAAVREGWISERMSHPWNWEHWLARLARHRSLAVGLSTLDVYAQDVGSHAAHPLLDPRFLAALARDGGRTGFGDRTAMMRTLFSHVLPEAILARERKARPGGGFWRGRSRAFADSWDGTGIDEEMVDPLALRAIWRSTRPPLGAIALLQQAWLAGAVKGTS